MFHVNKTKNILKLAAILGALPLAFGSVNAFAQAQQVQQGLKVIQGGAGAAAAGGKVLQGVEAGANAVNQGGSDGTVSKGEADLFKKPTSLDEVRERRAKKPATATEEKSAGGLYENHMEKKTGKDVKVVFLKDAKSFKKAKEEAKVDPKTGVGTVEDGETTINTEVLKNEDGSAENGLVSVKSKKGIPAGMKLQFNNFFVGKGKFKRIPAKDFVLNMEGADLKNEADPMTANVNGSVACLTPNASPAAAADLTAPDAGGKHDAPAAPASEE
jgi:hypothetical protein